MTNKILIDEDKREPNSWAHFEKEFKVVTGMTPLNWYRQKGITSKWEGDNYIHIYGIHRLTLTPEGAKFELIENSKI